jgi:hypothetical protein
MSATEREWIQGKLACPVQEHNRKRGILPALVTVGSDAFSAEPMLVGSFGSLDLYHGSLKIPYYAGWRNFTAKAFSWCDMTRFTEDPDAFLLMRLTLEVNGWEQRWFDGVIMYEPRVERRPSKQYFAVYPFVGPHAMNAAHAFLSYADPEVLPQERTIVPWHDVSPSGHPAALIKPPYFQITED